MLNEDAKIFSDLNRSKSNPWPEETKFEAPHKPLLLVSVIDLINESVISSNIIHPSDQLLERFTKLWDEIGLENLSFETEPSIHLPFFHLANEREVFVGAEINEDLFQYLLRDDSRSVLRETLTQGYFSPAVFV